MLVRSRKSMRRFGRIETLEPRRLLAVVIDNLPATEITLDSASVGVDVQSIDAFQPVISLFWGENDHGTNFDAWPNRELMGSRDVGQHRLTLSGLTLDTDYFYRTHGFSFGGDTWAPATATFTTLPPSAPELESRPVQFAGATNALLHGVVTEPAGEIPEVTVYYGDEDAGAQVNGWDASIDLGLQDGEFTVHLTSLLPSTDYSYRFAATNSAGTTWTASDVFQTPDVAALRISELSATSAETFNDEEMPFSTRVRSRVDLDFGGTLSTYDWFEIENNTAAEIDLTGFSISDDAEEPAKWTFPEDTQVPALGTIGVFASDLDITDPTLDEQGWLHANFRLSSEGEFLGLFDTEGQLVHGFAPRYPLQVPHASYGLVGNEAHYMTPSPGSPNFAGQPALATPPVFSVDGGVFGQPIQLELSAEPAEATIRYTLDGSVPDATSPVFEQPIVIEGSTEVRASTHLAGHLSSMIAGQSYIIASDDAMSFSSHLPIVVLESFDRRRPSRTRHVDYAMSIHELDQQSAESTLANPDIVTRIGIKVRGQSSAGDPKTPYRIETRDQYNRDQSIAPLGLPADSDWVLYGPWSDRTLIHNAYSYELGRDLGINAPRTRYVEVFRNQDNQLLDVDDYLGVYLLVESVKRTDDRVDIPDLDPGQLGSDEISGGYIIRFEQNVSEREDRLDGWQHLELFDGQKYSIEQKQWITNYVNQADEAIGRAGDSYDYEEWLNVDSFVDSLVIHELGRDQDAYVRSYYLYKDRGDKLTAGPLWDFNLTFNRGCCFDNRNPRGWQFDQDRPGRPTGWNKGEHNWNGKLLDSKGFSQQFIDRWNSLRQPGGPLSLESLYARIDRHVERIGVAADRNFQRWPNVLTSNAGFPGPRFATHEEHIEDMKQWIAQRVAWIDEQFRTPPTLVRQNDQFSFEPSTGRIYYTLDGTDPFDRVSGGPAANAIAFQGQPFQVSPDATLTARVLDDTVEPNRTELVWTQWSAPTIRPADIKPVAGDVDGDGLVDSRDIAAVCDAIHSQTDTRLHDLNDDGRVDQADVDHLVRDILGSRAGDANLDGVFDSRDLIAIAQAGQFEDQVADNSTWATGDWNCDGEFTTKDIIEAFQAGTTDA